MAERRWWGWGTVDRSFDLGARPDFLPYVRARLGPSPGPTPPVVPVASIRLPAPSLPNEAIAGIVSCLVSGAITSDPMERILHSGGKGYCDLIRARRGEFSSAPDLVVYPRKAEEVSRLLAWAEKTRCAMIPFGGGTSVVGGVTPRKGAGHVGAVSLDLSLMSAVISIDDRSLTARVQAGCFGPQLEGALAPRNLMLGHFPQSFEFSTLGGWIATRSAGMMSTGFGKIEDMVEALTVVTPRGSIATRDLPSTANGPGIVQTLVGSEGVLGVITEATMRIRREPPVAAYWGAVFRSFPQGTEALRLCLQDDCAPVMARLSDEAETELLRVLRGGGPSGIGKTLARWSIGDRPCWMALGVTGDAATAKREMDQVNRHIRRCGGKVLPIDHQATVFRGQFQMPYLRDALIGEGMLVETLETATTWSNLARLYSAVRRGIADALARTGVTPWVGTHCSHAYRDGASLYFTFVAWAKPGEEIAQWQAAKNAACEAILANGGTLSHHHGIGRDHAKWLPAEIGEGGIAMIRALKREFDPAGICNPGLLLHES